MDYIPLVTDDFRITFCKVTAPLCPDIQRLIWEKVLYEDIRLEPPPTPKKCRIRYSRAFENLSPLGHQRHLHYSQTI
jgi:hypothetical protein